MLCLSGIGRIVAIAAFAGVLGLVRVVSAADFPSKVITIVVPYTAGGSSDALARLLGQQLATQFGQPVIVENKPGAGATIGTDAVARAAPDGHTVLLADTAQTTAPAMYRRLPYDAVKSFRAVGMVGVTPAMLFTAQQSSLRTVKDMLDVQKTRPDGFTIGVGSGTASQLVSELFQIQSGVKLQMIPYKGASQTIIDVLSGQIDLVFTNPASAAQYLQSGKMKAIGVTGPRRDPAFPDLATFGEQGVSDMNVAYWFALLLPSGASDAIVQRWEKELATALAAPAVKRRLAELAIAPGVSTPAETQRFLANDLETWARIVKSAGIEPQ